MQYVKFCFATTLLFIAYAVQAQTFNWARSGPETRQIANLNLGLEHGVVAGAAYGYYLPAKRPFLLGAEVSVPWGNALFDDFKIKLGGQMLLFDVGHFKGVGGLNGIYRRVETSLVRFDNFGAELTATIGYYRPCWFVAANIGFDKAIVTRFKHSASYRESFPQVQDGWYEPATGGNYQYGAQVGFSLRRMDIYLKAGQMLTQDFENRPLLPFYAQVGVSRRF